MGTEVVFPGSPNGIVATICVSVQLVVVAVCPPTLNQYDSSGTAGNNPCPVIVICVPIFPDVGVIPEIVGVCAWAVAPMRTTVETTNSNNARTHRDMKRFSVE